MEPMRGITFKQAGPYTLLKIRERLEYFDTLSLDRLLQWIEDDTVTIYLDDIYFNDTVNISEK